MQAKAIIHNIHSFILVLQSSAQYTECHLLDISSQVMKILLLQTSKLLRTKSNLLEILYCILILKANPGVNMCIVSTENTNESPMSPTKWSLVLELAKHSLCIKKDEVPKGAAIQGLPLIPSAIRLKRSSPTTQNLFFFHPCTFLVQSYILTVSYTLWVCKSTFIK